MIRSMWSAVSGLRNHQIYLDVTGNNIANVNTIGYKSTRAVFEDTLSQTVRNAAAPSTAGGMNPTQVGLGVKLGQISGDFKQGGFQVTNVPTDMAIQGDGFFVVQRGTEQFFTRNGAFSLDQNGELVTSDGGYVLQQDGSTHIKIDPAEVDTWQISPDGKITGYKGTDTVDLGVIGVAKFVNPQGLDRVGGTMFRETLNSGPVDIKAPEEEGRGQVFNNHLEMSNVDLAGEFTNLIMAQRGFQANSKVVTASDEVLQDLINMKR